MPALAVPYQQGLSLPAQGGLCLPPTPWAMADAAAVGAKHPGSRVGAATAYAVGLVLSGGANGVDAAISATRRRPGWRTARGLSRRNIYEQVALAQQRQTAATAAKKRPQTRSAVFVLSEPVRSPL